VPSIVPLPVVLGFAGGTLVIASGMECPLI
jgi:hypothetical protein